MIGAQIKKWCLIRGMKQSELAYGICQPSNMCLIERNIVDVNSEKIRLFASRLNIPVEELFVIEVQQDVKKSKRVRDVKKSPEKVKKSKRKKRKKKLKEYAAYKGDRFIGIGTLQELATIMGVKKQTVYFYTTPSSRKRNTENGIVVFTLDDE